MAPVKQLVRLVSRWHEVTVHPHRCGEQEFRMGTAEIGHVHGEGTLDIPFAGAVRDLLVEEGLAAEHRWVPDAGRVAFRMCRVDDLKRAIWLLRLSWVRYLIRSTEDPESFLAQESNSLQLRPTMNSLLAKLIPSAVRRMNR